MSITDADRQKASAVLAECGWYPGGYCHKACRQCGKPFDGAKSAYLCIVCAVARIREGVNDLRPISGGELSFKALRAKSAERATEWVGHRCGTRDLLFRAVELGGETGEMQEAVLMLLDSLAAGAHAGKVLDKTKKIERTLAGAVGGVDLSDVRQALKEELADVIICVDRVAESIGIDLGQAVKEKFNKTSDKNGLSVKFEE